MSIYTKPSATFFSELENAGTGLVGTLHVQVLRKSDGAAVVARTTSGIVESPAGSGRYVASIVAPGILGDYTVLWDKGSVVSGQTAADDLIVTLSIAEEVEPSVAGVILTLPEYKTRRQISEADPERDEAIEAALAAAEDAVLQYTGRDFTTAQGVETREYPWEVHTTILETDDFVGKPSVVTFEVPGVGDAAPYPIAAYWVGPREGQTHYYLDFTPSRAYISSVSIGAMGFERNLDTYYERGGSNVDAVTAYVTAEFGWPGDAPASIKQAVTWLVDEFAAGANGVGANGEELQAEGIANLTYAYQRDPTSGRTATLPPRVQQLLDPYRRIAL